jgi:DNA helicase HerA-like ATPase
VLGKTRSGKSSVLRGLVEGILEREQPVCIVDPKGDWWGIKLARDGKRPGYPVVIFGGEHADVPINAHAGAHVAELFATGNRPCLIDLGGWMVGERTRFYIDFASTLFRLTKGMRWLVIDEIHNFAPKGKVMDPDAGKALHWTNRLASEGLGKGLPMLFASQRPQKVHNDTLTSAETLIAMRVLHPSDRGAVSDWIKGCGDLELGAKVLNSLAQMDRGEGWVWSPEIGLGPERVKFPMFKTYDSFRPQTAEDAAALKGWAEVDLTTSKAKPKLARRSVVKEAEAARQRSEARAAPR